MLSQAMCYHSQWTHGLVSVAVLVHRALHGQLPQYLAEDWQLLTDIGRQSLRSADILMCSTIRTRTRLGDRSFSVAGPCLVSGTLYLSHYVTEISHLYSSRDFWRHFGLCRAAAHSDCCFLRSVQIFLLTDLLTYSHDPATVIRDEVGATGKKNTASDASNSIRRSGWVEAGGGARHQFIVVAADGPMH